MNNMFKRWYDVDAAVSNAVNSIELSTEQQQVRCAEFIIDLLKDVELETMSLEDQYNYILRRWYDKNIRVSHAIECLRLAPNDVRREVALKVIEYLDEIKKEENS